MTSPTQIVAVNRAPGRSLFWEGEGEGEGEGERDKIKQGGCLLLYTDRSLLEEGRAGKAGKGRKGKGPRVKRARTWPRLRLDSSLIWIRSPLMTTMGSIRSARLVFRGVVVYSYPFPSLPFPSPNDHHARQQDRKHSPDLPPNRRIR